MPVDIIEVALIIIVIALIVFFILRELFCWYLKTNEAISLLKDIRDSLKSYKESTRSSNDKKNTNYMDTDTFMSLKGLQESMEEPDPKDKWAKLALEGKKGESKDKVDRSELEDLKVKFSKTRQLLDKLDERLANGEINEAQYKLLSEKYKLEAEKLKNLVTEKELMKEVDLKAK